MSPKAFTLLAVLFLGLACGRVSPDDARALVEHYNQVVGEAYRRCDVHLIDQVVTADGLAGKNLTGLIGVRMDMGLILDAHLDELQVVSVQRSKNELEIHTRERWTYLDRRVGSGEQVGEASEDRYEILYLFQRVKGAWLVRETRFAAPPQVGRKATPWQMDAQDAHAMIAPTQGGKP